MRLTPQAMLRGYAAGIFPMAERRGDPEVFWVDPRRRGVMPMEGPRLSRSLRRSILRGGWEATFDADFAGTLAGCAARPETWINGTLGALYLALHRSGHAHSQEVWHRGRLAGGVFGVALGGAFFGESMFSERPDASKVALAHLMHRLRAGGFALFDTQFLTPHLASLGAVEIDRAEYRRRLADALPLRADPFAAPAPTPQEVVQRSTQTS